MIFEISYTILILTCLLRRTIFSFIKHPLAIGLILLIQTILICLIRGLIIKTFWFSYVLFIIFLGGILVLFIYVTSLASNEIFNFSIKILVINFFALFITSFISILFDKTLFLNYFKNYEINSLTLQIRFLPENNLILNKLYNFPINLITILLIIYLFLTLIAIVKITNVFEGPLRPKY